MTSQIIFGNSNDRVSTIQKIAFSLGLVGDNYAIQNINLMAMAIYNVALGVSPLWVGMILAACRLTDAATDLLAGKTSDNCKFKSGRRRPMMVIGAILTALSVQAVWWVPKDLTETWMAAYFFFTLTLFYLSYTIYSVAYEALGMELTAGYEERTRVFAVRSIISNILNMGIPWFVAAAYWDVFEGPLEGARVVAAFVGVVIIVCGCCAAFNCKERYQKIGQAQERSSILDSLKDAGKNKPFLILVGVASINLFGIFLSSTIGFYVNTYYLYSGDLALSTVLGGYAGTLALIGSSLGSILAFYLAERVDKTVLMTHSLKIMFVATLLNWFMLTPENPYLSLVLQPILSAANMIFWVSVMSMKADACDWNEKLTGFRREGALSGVMGWSCKVGMSLGMFLAGAILSFTGFDVALKANQSHDVLMNMKITAIAIPAVSYFVCLILAYSYPLTKNLCYSSRQELELSRGAI